MPESKVRKKAAEKKAAARTKKHDDELEATKRSAKGPVSRDWVPWVFVPLGLLGVLWLLVFYIAGYHVPVMKDLQMWNYLIGLGLIAASFGVATLWK